MSANTTPVKVKKTDLSGTSTAYKVFAVVILIMLAIFFLFPLYWIVTGSFKSAIDINAKVPVWFPMNPTMGNYDKLFAKPASCGCWPAVSYTRWEHHLRPEASVL